MAVTSTGPGLHLPGHRIRPAGASLLAASLVGAVLFFLLAFAVWSATGPLPFDVEADALLSPHRGPALLASFALLTVLGSGNAVVIAGALASAWLAFQRRWRLAAIFWGMLACSGISTWLAKVLIARVRPEFVEGFAASSHSFPSSHAAAAIAGYGFMAYALCRGARPTTRWLAGIATALLVLVVASSRLVLGVHHATDVVGGLLLAGSWLLAGMHVAGQEPLASAARWRRAFPQSVAGSR